jgi:hypothetical protein
MPGSYTGSHSCSLSGCFSCTLRRKSGDEMAQGARAELESEVNKGAVTRPVKVTNDGGVAVTNSKTSVSWCIYYMVYALYKATT